MVQKACWLLDGVFYFVSFGKEPGQRWSIGKHINMVDGSGGRIESLCVTRTPWQCGHGDRLWKVLSQPGACRQDTETGTWGLAVDRDQPKSAPNRAQIW